MATKSTSYRPPIMGTTHMVSAGHPLAAAAGFRVFEEGGNAVDAGVASGIALNVVRPTSTNFGGVAPIIIYLGESDSVVTISGLGRWPRAASIEYFNRHAGGEIPISILRTVVARRGRRLAHGAGEVRHHELRAGGHAGAGAGRAGPPGLGVRPARPAEVFRRRVAIDGGRATGSEGPGAHVQAPQGRREGQRLQGSAGGHHGRARLLLQGRHRRGDGPLQPRAGRAPDPGGPEGFFRPDRGAGGGPLPGLFRVHLRRVVPGAGAGRDAADTRG